MKPLKDSIFIKVTGKLYLPYVKIASLLFIIPLVLIYSKLVDILEKQKLFYIICTSYTISFLVVAYLVNDPVIGLTNTTPDKWRLFGWSTYILIESFGSLVVALFWSFVASNTSTDSAKRGYSLIIAGAQIGTIAGPYTATHASYLGMTTLSLIIAGGITIIPILIKAFIIKYPTTAENKVTQTKKTGPIKGLKLLVTNSYLLGVLGIATLYDIIGTILEYQMLFLADTTYTSAEGLSVFLGYFGVATNGLALAFSVIGTSFFLRRFGLTFCLVMYPISVGLVILQVWAYSSLWILFAAMVAIKGLSYALNNPAKEILYIPTSKDVKFKTKGWIDMFGNRSAKALGAGINTFFDQAQALLLYGSIISLGVVGVWILIALYVGRRNAGLVESGKIIE
jgi:AAA family ATP:ADP antiporter